MGEQAGYTAQEIMNAIHEGEIKALLSICFNPSVSLPQSAYTARLSIVSSFSA